jgi:4-amino-4-deoxy-L-arabinose transferase-like glycosyltransferase
MMAPAKPGAASRSAQVLLGVVVLLMLLRLLTLGAYPLSDATEARYAEIARKMVELNDWVTPWYDYGVPFWAKPPMSTWITALSMKIFGVNEFAARLPHFLAGLLVIGLIVDWQRRRSNRSALLASALLSSSVLFFVSAGAVMTDMTLTVGIVLAMRGFWLGLYGAAPERRREHWLFFIGLAIGMLAKGPVALVLCGVPIALWAIFTGNIRTAWTGFSWLGGLLLVSVLAAPWYLLAEQHTPGFLHYFLVGEHWKRFTEPGWSGDRYGYAHAVPPGMIWLYAVAASLPWAFLLPVLACFRRQLPAAPVAAEERNWSRYLWTWALAPCLFFTASRNIIWTYMLPGLPALAMLGAAWLARDPNERRTDKAVIAGLVFSIFAFGGVLTFMKASDGFHSAKLVVNAVEQKNAGVASLAFVGHGVYSPSFYSGGRAMHYGAPADLANVFDHNAKGATAPAFVALLGSQWKQLTAQVRQHLHREGHYGIYDLYKVEP